MASGNELQGSYVDIRAIPVPPGHAPLEYDKDGALFFAWDTNALDHHRWSLDEFEGAVLSVVQGTGAPRNLDDLTILAAAQRARVYNDWKAGADAAEAAAAAAAAEKAAAEKAAREAAEAAERAAAEAAARAAAEAAERAAAEKAAREAAEAAERAAREAAEAAERAAREAAEAAEKAAREAAEAAEREAREAAEAAEAARRAALLAQIEGVSLSEYTQAQIARAGGVSFDTIAGALEIDPAVWAKAHQGWRDRMSADDTFFVKSEFGRLYQEGITDPRLQAIIGVSQSTDEANLSRLHTDRTFAVELSAARSAAYGAGLDGNAWVMDNFGIAPGDLQTAEDGYEAPEPLLTPAQVAMGDAEQWRQVSLLAAAGDQGARNHIKDNMVGAANWLALRHAFYDAYVQRFTAQMGGGVADDITF